MAAGTAERITEPRHAAAQAQARDRASSMRARAWRNLMVCAINAGLAQKLFSLRGDDNRWPDAGTEGCLFEFALPNGWPARGNVRDIGYAELSVRISTRATSYGWCRRSRINISLNAPIGKCSHLSSPATSCSLQELSDAPILKQTCEPSCKRSVSCMAQ